MAEVAQHVFTPAQIEQGITRAIADRAFEVLPVLLLLLARQAPERAVRACFNCTRPVGLVAGEWTSMTFLSGVDGQVTVVCPSCADPFRPCGP